MVAFLYTLYAHLGGIKYLSVVMRHPIATEMEGPCMMYWISELWCIISPDTSRLANFLPWYTFLGNVHLL